MKMEQHLECDSEMESEMDSTHASASSERARKQVTRYGNRAVFTAEQKRLAHIRANNKWKQKRSSQAKLYVAKCKFMGVLLAEAGASKKRLTMSARIRELQADNVALR